MSPPKRTIKTFGGTSGSSGITSISQKSAVPFKKGGNVVKSVVDQSISTPKKSTTKDMTVGISDEELMNMDIKDLNDFLRRLPKEAASQARKRRRLLKNRGYAQSTRTKRITTIEEASARKEELMTEIGVLKREIERLRGKKDNLRMTRSRMERAQGISSIPSGYSIGDSAFKFVKKEDSF